jgi:hypothetical protein
MADATTEVPPIPASRIDDETVQQYIHLLIKIVDNFAATQGDAGVKVRTALADPKAKIGPDLIELIRTLCDCKAIIVILECLCKLITD